MSLRQPIFMSGGDDKKLTKQAYGAGREGLRIPQEFVGPFKEPKIKRTGIIPKKINMAKYMK